MQQACGSASRFLYVHHCCSQLISVLTACEDRGRESSRTAKPASFLIRVSGLGFRAKGEIHRLFHVLFFITDGNFHELHPKTKIVVSIFFFIIPV